MNQFKRLDTLFPVGENRTCGEVVALNVSVHDDINGKIGVAAAKRKASYVNASVNAFHLHRDLCSDIRRLAGDSWTPIDYRSVYRRLAYLVNLCYTREAENGNSVQYYDFTLILMNNGFETIISHFENTAGVSLRIRDSLNWETVPFEWRRCW